MRDTVRNFLLVWVGAVALAACLSPPAPPPSPEPGAAFVLGAVSRAAGVAAKCVVARDEVCVEQGAELVGALLEVLAARGAAP